MPQVTLAELVDKVSAGQALASFPTDTVPALAARPDRADLIFSTKQRSLEKPLILMAAGMVDLWQYVVGSEAERRIWQQVSDHYLPGALTLVLPASPLVPAAMNPKDPTTVGIRVPDHALACMILQMTGPLATTSANRSGQPALQTLPEIEAEFPEVLTLTSVERERLGDDASQQEASGVPSTVAKWTGDSWEILRQGVVVLV